MDRRIFARLLIVIGILSLLAGLTTAVSAAPPALPQAAPSPRPPAFGGQQDEEGNNKRGEPDIHSDVWGIVTDLSTGQPGQGMAVIINGAVVTTDSSGHFSLTGLPAGSYTVRLELPVGASPARPPRAVQLDGRSAVTIALEYYSGPVLAVTPAATATRELKSVVDGRARRAQVLDLTSGAQPQPAGGLSAQALPPQTATWNVYDHYNFTDVAVDFTLAYTSTYGFYYVDNSVTVSADTLVNVGAAFDANYISVIGNFGSIPDVDGERRVFVLLTDILDEYSYDAGATTYVSCFFDPFHAHPSEPGSNGREMIFLDVNPTTPDSGKAGRCLAHQLALMVAYNYDTQEAYWADEGMAYLAEFVAGYGHRPEAEVYLADPNVPLAGWTGGEADIGKVYLWTLYLRQRFGQSGVRDILHSPLHGLDSIEPVLEVSKGDLFHQWVVANYLDDPVQAGGLYSYAEIDIVPGGADQVASFTRPPLYETVLVADKDYEIITGALSGYYAARYVAIGRSSGVELVISDTAPDGPYGQSTLINNNTRFFNWTGRMVDIGFCPGDTAILAIGLSRETGSTQYRYNVREYFLYDYYLPLVLK